jgi:hypothetical protein
MVFRAARLMSGDMHFGVIEVSPDVMRDEAKVEEALRKAHPPFPTIPTIVVAQEKDGTILSFGDPSLVRAFKILAFESVEWHEYSSN